MDTLHYVILIQNGKLFNLWAVILLKKILNWQLCFLIIVCLCCVKRRRN